MPKILITTELFGKKNRHPIKLIENTEITYLINPLIKKLAEDKLEEMITVFDVIIDRIERITAKVLDKAKKLTMITC